MRLGRQPEYIHMCGGGRLTEPEYPARREWGRWYHRARTEEYSWMIDLDGHAIGTAGFHHISEADNCATYRIGIFDVNRYSQGIGTDATRLLLEYGFQIKKWHRIDLKVLEYNHRGIRCYEKCGFKRDGILRESACIDGIYYSDIVMSILDYEYGQNIKP